MGKGGRVFIVDYQGREEEVVIIYTSKMESQEKTTRDMLGFQEIQRLRPGDTVTVEGIASGGFIYADGIYRTN